jgi:Ca2+-binding RTX toxin-like protein
MKRVLLMVAAVSVALLAAAGVALAVDQKCAGDCAGTDNPDTLVGSTKDQTMKGLGAGDSVSGRRGDDVVVGGRGGDALYGGLGDDKVYGNQGNDYVEGDYGHDYISTGGGSDKVAARDGYKDRVLCGQGNRDLVYVDKIDITRGCERTTDKKPNP